MSEFEVRLVSRSQRTSSVIFKKGFFLVIDDDDKDLKFGLFLAKYGETILQRFHLKKEEKRWLEDKFSFPMKLSVKTNEDYFSFNGINSESKTIHCIFDSDKSVFLLETIPGNEVDEWKGNVIHNVGDGSYRQTIINLVCDYAVNEEDAEKVLTVKIVNVVEGAELVALFSFMKEDVEGISYGMFLSRYGKDILDLFRVHVASIPPFDRGSSFPMKLTFGDEFHMGGCFENFFRDQTLHWNVKGENILFLHPISPDDMANFNANVADLQPPECIICFGDLHKPVFAFDAELTNDNMTLPTIPLGDVFTLSCSHMFHTHCILKCCFHNFFKCSRCTRKPDKTWWKGQFRNMGLYLEICHSEIISDIYELERQLKILQDKTIDELGEMRQFIFEQKQKEVEVSNKRLNMSIIDTYLKFIRQTQRTSDSWFRSQFRFQEDDMPNLNGFQRLNLLLDRNL